ncbi:MAG: hypothetical protein RLZZ200_2520 [Pseudomonadota bacterium]|jgi:gamma-glutamylputrescine oxidase
MIVDNTPWYEVDGPAPTASPPLDGDATVDACIVGGGIAGCSAALHLAQAGHRVLLLEADRVGGAASGRNGGQLIPGAAASQDVLEGLLGPGDARQVWDCTVESLALLRDLVSRHGIDCDLAPGHLQVAVRPRHDDELRAWQDCLQDRYGYPHTRLLSRDALHAHVGSDRYRSGLLDTNGGHLQPLKYVRGLARAAQSAGARIHEGTPALSWSREAGRLAIRTERGIVRARQLLLAGNALLGAFEPRLARRILGVGTYVVATEPLGPEVAATLLPSQAAVSDCNWILDYFRLSRDHRLLFGGRVSYSGLEARAGAAATRRRMLRVFPQLEAVRITHVWGGWLDITRNRAPDFGRLEADVYYLQGFSGHGVSLAGMAGKLVSEAMSGTAGRFDVFARIPHRAFPGGAPLRRPALVLAMLWYRLRDLL